MSHAPQITPREPLKQPQFLPMTRADMKRIGWDELDVLFVSGDAYVDHPSFGMPLLGRWLVAHGYRVGIVSQPRWDTADDLLVMGRPRLYAGVSAGCLDSMLAHYTAFRKKRSDDAYTPGGQAGARPNRAAIVYANLVRRAFPALPVVLGGIEASLRRVSHYDFWSDSLRRSVLLDSKATAVLYGMAETGMLALTRGMDALVYEAEKAMEVAAPSVSGDGVTSNDLHSEISEESSDNVSRTKKDVAKGKTGGTAAPKLDPLALRRMLATVPGAVFAGGVEDLPEGAETETLPSHEEIEADPKILMQATLQLEQQVHQDKAYALQQSAGRTVVLTPPGPGLDGPSLDGLYGLPFSRVAHPSYTAPIPAEEMIKGSVTAHRGCAGGCSFCTLALHQGRRIRSRSRESILAEVERMTRVPGFNGSISDVGGPSANMWNARCASDPSRCKRHSCMTPRICKHFKIDQGEFVDLLEGVRQVDGVRHVRVASGWRMDLGLADREALGRMVREFVGGQAKVAPENMSDRVLALMRKPGFEVFEEFARLFGKESANAGKEQYVIPYLMSAFPGCSDDDMRAMAAWFKRFGFKPNQVQCFIPLPGTAAAAMYWAGVDEKGEPLYVPRTDAQRLRQHAMLAPQGGKTDARRSRGKGRGGNDGQEQGTGKGPSQGRGPGKTGGGPKSPRENRGGKGYDKRGGKSGGKPGGERGGNPGASRDDAPSRKPGGNPARKSSGKGAGPGGKPSGKGGKGRSSRSSGGNRGKSSR